MDTSTLVEENDRSPIAHYNIVTFHKNEYLRYIDVKT